MEPLRHLAFLAPLLYLNQLQDRHLSNKLLLRAVQIPALFLYLVAHALELLRKTRESMAQRLRRPEALLSTDKTFGLNRQRLLTSLRGDQVTGQ